MDEKWMGSFSKLKLAAVQERLLTAICCNRPQKPRDMYAQLLRNRRRQREKESVREGLTLVVTLTVHMCSSFLKTHLRKS